jgi:LytS/YehU family sensor histidine kinase
LHGYGVNLVIALCIGVAIHALFRLVGAGLGDERVRGLHGWRRALMYGGVPMLGLCIGWPAGAWLVSGTAPAWSRLADADTLASGLLLGLLITTAMYVYFAAKARQIEAERRAAEAQLRLLQGQIEPHFLFNTLAGVLALIDHDSARARQMLEAFTEHLRGSLGALRRDEGTLDDELARVNHYLVLMASRMEDRLRFRIDADSAARQAVLPPLLLQPLVENAVVHGLEPTVAGGTVSIAARLDGAARLVIEVRDDGQGRSGPGGRGGAGLALDNIRQRLRGRWGDDARLEIIDARPGTLARLTLPLAASGAAP